MSNQKRKSSAVSVGNWMLTMLLAAIPVVNIIYVIIIACASRKTSKRNWAIAAIIWAVILTVASVCTVVFFGEEILAFLLMLVSTPVTEIPALLGLG